MNNLAETQQAPPTNLNTVQQIVPWKKTPKRSVQKTKRTVQEAFRTVQETKRTVQEAYRTVQKQPYYAISVPNRTVHMV